MGLTSATLCEMLREVGVDEAAISRVYSSAVVESLREGRAIHPRLCSMLRAAHVPLSSIAQLRSDMAQVSNGCWGPCFVLSNVVGVSCPSTTMASP